MNKPLILISNDDSIFSQGINILVEVAKKFGEVIVVAPDSPQSAKSNALTLEIPLFVREIDIFEDVKAYKCSGTPADCVKIAINQILKRKPDLVLSGINHGSNTSVNILYSGTVAAAMEGCIHEINSIAFSITTYDTNIDFELAKNHCEKIIKYVMENNLENGTCLNVNIPHIKLHDSKGIKVCRQTKGMWAEEFEKRTHPRNNRDYYWITGTFVNLAKDETDNDIWAVKNNYTAVVPIKIDLTNYLEINRIKSVLETEHYL